MKLVYILLLLFLSFSAFAQDPLYEGRLSKKEKAQREAKEKQAIIDAIKPLPMNEDKTAIEYQEVVNIEGKTKDQIYQAARSWFAKSFKSANHVIQMDDKELGSIVGKGIYNDVHFTLSIDVKDNKYRYTISDVKINFIGSPLGAEFFVKDSALYNKDGSLNMTSAKSRIQVQEALSGISTNIKEGINTSLNDNW